MILRFISLFVYLFPIWAILLCGIALWYEGAFSWFLPEWIPISLGLIMLFMGMTLKWEDITRISKNPTFILLGVVFQFTIMPIGGWIISNALQLSPELASGLILVSCCPGGTASNVMSYLGKLDVALSISMTFVSTLVGIFATPLLSYYLIGSKVNVDGFGLFFSSVKVVFIPLVFGFFLAKIGRKTIYQIENYFPFFATLFILLIVASIVGSSKKFILENFWILLLSVFLTHSLGFVLGYFFTYILSKNLIVSKTISIEVGMQNSGLGVALAKENFSNPLVAVAPSISSLVHSILASVLVGIWNLNSYFKSKKI